MKPALRLTHVSKYYGWRQKQKALDQLSIEVPAGVICGLIGPNGAGKTTTFSLVGGFIQPDEGEIDILGGGGFDPERLKGRLGVLPQDAELGDRHTPLEFLEHLARLQGIKAGEARARAITLLEQLNLGDRKDRKIQSLSHGMRRRVAVASALIGDPELVLLDEPTSGLDPRQVLGLRQMLDTYRGKTTLVVSSHVLTELEALCDYVIFMDKGRCTRQGPIAEVTGRTQLLLWTLAIKPRDLRRLQDMLPGHQLEWDGQTLSHRAPAAADLDEVSLRVTSFLSHEGIAIRELRRGVSLEQSFMEGS